MSPFPSHRRRGALIGLVAMTTTALVVGGSWASPGSGENDHPGRGHGPNGVVNIAHRGAAAMTPENTHAGFAYARDTRANLIEIDVQLSADDVPVLVHDATLKRTTNATEVFPDRDSYAVGDFTWAELQQLDAGSWYHQDFAGERIPRLEEMLQYARRGAGVNIELKSPDRSPGVEQVVADVLDSDRRWHALNRRGGLVVSSFDLDSLATFHDLRPDVPASGVGVVPDDDATLESYAAWMDSWTANYRTLDPADISRVQDAGLDFVAYTVNSADHMQAVIDLGVDAIVTDAPQVLNRVKSGSDPLPDAQGLVVDRVVADAAGSDCQDDDGEYLVVRNTSDEALDLTGWFLLDAVANRLDFGDSVVPAGETLRVYPCDGVDSDDAYYNDLGRNILNNNGDSIAIFTPDRTLVELYAYYPCTAAGAPCPPSAGPAPDNVTNVGHRGAAMMAPELTRAGFDFARDSNAQLMEIDVQLSADGVPVLVHDQTLTRTTNVTEVFPDRDSYLVGDFTWAELQQLDAGSYYRPDFAGERIPRLRDVIRYAHRGPGVMIEIKAPHRSPGIEQAIADVLASDPRWDALNRRGGLTAISFDLDSLATFHELRPDIPVSGIVSVPQDEETVASYASWMDSLVVNFRDLNIPDVERARRHGLGLIASGANSPDTIQRMFDLRVDGLITDVPQVLDRLKSGSAALPDARGLVVDYVIANAPGADCQDDDGEHIVFQNTTDTPIDVSDWYTLDQAGNSTGTIGRLSLGETVIAPGDRLFVYACDGDSGGDRYYNDFGGPMLNNAGDSIGLFTPDHELVELHSYYSCSAGVPCPDGSLESELVTFESDFYRIDVQVAPHVAIDSLAFAPDGDGQYREVVDTSTRGFVPFVGAGRWSPVVPIGKPAEVVQSDDGRTLTLNGIEMIGEPITVDWELSFDDEWFDHELTWHVAGQPSQPIYQAGWGFDGNLTQVGDSDILDRERSHTSPFPDWTINWDNDITVVAAYLDGSAWDEDDVFFSTAHNFITWTPHWQSGGGEWPEGDYEGGRWRVGASETAADEQYATDLHSALNAS